MKLRPGYIKRILGGAVFGLYMGYLVFFLNPQIDVTPARLAPVVIVYALLWGAIFGTALWLLRVARVRILGRTEGDFRPHGFGYIVVAAFLSTAIYWGHLAFFRIYLPPGAVRILSKATTLLGAVAFALLLLWVVERNAEKRLSNWIVLVAGVLILFSSFVLYQRRGSYRERERPVVPVPIAVHAQQKVTIVAIRSLPYDWIVTLTGEGELPYFKRGTESGFFTRMRPFNSSSSRSVWASLATGKLPHRHGVTGRYSYRTLLNPGEPWLNVPIGIGFRNWGLLPPVERISAPLPSGNALPVWGMFQRAGSTPVVVNWPASTGRLRSVPLAITDEICRNPAAAISPGFAPQLVTLCREAGQIDPQLLLRLEPLSASRFATVRQAVVSDDASVKAAIRLANSTGASLTVVSLTEVDSMVHALEVEGNNLPGSDSRAGDIIRAGMHRVDALLAEIDRSIDGDILIVVSPSGPRLPSIPASPAAAIAELFSDSDKPGSDEGFLLVMGPRTTPAPNPPIVQVVDLVPTALFGAGLPIARDFDGRVVTEAFADPALSGSSALYIQSYEAAAPDSH